MEAFRRLYDDLIGRSGLQTRGMINEADSREIKKGAKNTLFENPRKKSVEIIEGPSKSPQKARKGSERVARVGQTCPNYPFPEGVGEGKKSQKKSKKVKIWPNWAKKGSNPRKRPIRAKKRPIREKKGARAKKWENSGKKVAEKNV